MDNICPESDSHFCGADKNEAISSCYFLEMKSCLNGKEIRIQILNSTRGKHRQFLLLPPKLQRMILRQTGNIVYCLLSCSKKR